MRANRSAQRETKNESTRPFRISIDIHGGQAIVGTMGPPSAPNYSAIGDCVNAAARLQVRTKDLEYVVVVSDEVVNNVNADFTGIPSQKVELHDKQRSVLTYATQDLF